MSIINALSLLETENAADFKPGELVAIARRNSDRLNQALASLLDLAAIESGSFHIRLREVDLARLIEGRVREQALSLKDRSLKVEVDKSHSSRAEGGMTPLLADPQKLGRAMDLSLHSIAARGKIGSRIRIEVLVNRLRYHFELEPTLKRHWDQAWSQALAGYQGGVASPGSAFAGTLQSEQAFLTREEEGLGSEFLLIHEIMRQHQGSFLYEDTLEGSWLTLEIPELSSEEGLRAVLASRAHQASNELSAVALGLVQVPEGTTLGEFRKELQRHLFRSSDAAYALPELKVVALVLDDCKPEDAPGLLHRIERGLKSTLHFGIAACPSEGIDPLHLIELATRRLREAVKRT